MIGRGMCLESFKRQAGERAARRGPAQGKILKTVFCVLTAMSMMAGISARAATNPNLARHCASEVVKRALTESQSALIVVDASEKFHHLRVDGYAGTDVWASVSAASDTAKNKGDLVFAYAGPGDLSQGRNQMRLWFERCLTASAQSLSP